MIKLSDNFEKERNLLIINSFLIFLAIGTKFNGEIKIPLLDIALPINQDTLLIFLFLNIYFIFRFVLEWIKSNEKAKQIISHKIDFYISFLIGISSVVSIWHSFTSNSWIWNVENLLLSVFLLIIGEFVFSMTMWIFELLVYIRSEEEASKLYLPRIPYFLKIQLIWIPINIVILLITWLIVENFMNEQIQNYWYIIVFSPFLIHLVYLIHYFLFPDKEKRKKMQLALDQYEVRIFHANNSSILNQFTEEELLKISKFTTTKDEYENILQQLKNGLNPNKIVQHGWTPFMLSVANGDIKLVKLYLEYGADVNVQNTLGRTAILFAINYNYYELVELLIEHGADIDNKSLYSKNEQPIIKASAKGHLKIVKLLIDLGADTTVTDLEGKTALDYAEENKHGEVAKILRMEKIKNSQ